MGLFRVRSLPDCTHRLRRLDGSKTPPVFLCRRRGRMAFALFLLGVVLLLTACGQNVVPPRQKRVLTWPNVGITDLAQLDPALVGDQNSVLAAQLVFSGLVKLNAALQVVPDAAYSWQVSPDGKTYTFYLPANLSFADGTPVTAQDVIYSLDRSLQMTAQAVQQGGDGALFYLGHILGAADVAARKTGTAAGLKALDAQTLQIQLDAPVAYFLADLTAPAAFIVPRQVIQKYGNRWVEHALGTGPFVLNRWVHSVRMIFTPNPFYYGDKPVLNELDMPFVENPHAALLAYRAGQYDLVWGLSGSDYPESRTQKNFHESTLLGTDALVPNTTREPFNHYEVRQAFALALDVQVLADQVMGNSVVPSTTIVPAEMPNYTASAVQGLGHDAQRARQLLQAAYPDASMLPTVTLTYASNMLPQAEAQAMQQMWQAVLGIQVSLVAVDPSTYQRELQDGQVQLGMTNWAADLPDPWDVLSLNLQSSGPGNVGGWKNTQFDQFVGQADLLFNDPAQRASLYQQAEQLAVNDGAWIPLDHPKYTAFIAPYVHGVVVTPLGLLAPDWAKVTISNH
jgi:oligopeptide transport system substrate-binding protein